jgi:hypothetical protein
VCSYVFMYKYVFLCIYFYSLFSNVLAQGYIFGLFVLILRFEFMYFILCGILMYRYCTCFMLARVLRAGLYCLCYFSSSDDAPPPSRCLGQSSGLDADKLLLQLEYCVKPSQCAPLAIDACPSGVCTWRDFQRSLMVHGRATHNPNQAHISGAWSSQVRGATPTTVAGSISYVLGYDFRANDILGFKRMYFSVYRFNLYLAQNPKLCRE